MTNRAHPTKALRDQQGVATLVVAMVLLFGMTLIAFFASRGQIFEQRTSANQYRSTRAFEMAEAGLDWAVARLNDERKLVAGTCTPDNTAPPANTSNKYIVRYLQATTAGFPTNYTSTRSGCSIAPNGQTTCGCPTPTPGATPTLGSADDPRFTVEFRTVADPWTIEVVSYGCTNGTLCDPGSAADSVAVVRALYKRKPALPNAPGAGLVTGSAAVTGGNLTVINLDVESNGITINSGTTVELGTATNAITLPGTPPRASVLDNDPSLAALTTADATGDIYFASFFGQKIDEYKNDPKTFLITRSSCGTNTDRCARCTGDLNCGTAVSTAYDKGFSQFWADDTVSFTSNLPAVTAENPSGTLGTAARPIMLATDEGIELRSNLTAYGLFYSATATATEDWTFTGSGSAKVFGSFVSRGDFIKGAGTLDVIYDANIFRPAPDSGLMVRVPGSWRDKSSAF